MPIMAFQRDFFVCLFSQKYYAVHKHRVKTVLYFLKLKCAPFCNMTINSSRISLLISLRQKFVLELAISILENAVHTSEVAINLRDEYTVYTQL